MQFKMKIYPLYDKSSSPFLPSYVLMLPHLQFLTFVEWSQVLVYPVICIFAVDIIVSFNFSHKMHQPEW